MRSYKDIEYLLKKSQRKTGSIYVERDGTISVHVPKTFKKQDIEKLIESRRAWIYKNLAEWTDLNATKVEREFTNGEGFLYLGRTYRLKLVDQQEEPLLLKNGYFCLQTNGKSDANWHEAFKNFYKEKGKVKISERIAYYEPKMGVKSHSVRIMELKHRWASCSVKGNINFHWKCMMSPPTILDYIVVHELAHLIHANHTEAFWNEVDKVLPDYQERKAWLRTHGAGMGL